jgi:hypothetical protein
LGGDDERLRRVQSKREESVEHAEACNCRGKQHIREFETGAEDRTCGAEEDGAGLGGGFGFDERIEEGLDAGLVQRIAGFRSRDRDAGHKSL